MEVARLERTVVIVARGAVTQDEIRSTVQELIDLNLPQLAKVIDVSSATSELSLEQIERIADLLRGRGEEGQGPVAFVINPERVGFAHAFATATKGERPLKLFRSIHDARRWAQGQTKL
ncbi:hypothetical protein BH11PSE3_BH11PSE3_41940 [soil metagenome]